MTEAHGVTVASAPTITPLRRDLEPGREAEGGKGGRRWTRGPLLGVLVSIALVVTLVAVLLAVRQDDDKAGARPDTASGPTVTSSSAAGIPCAAGTIDASGSTAQRNAMDQWIKDYQDACPDAEITYQAPGSSAGRQQFTSGQVDFAGSDSALKDHQKMDANARCAGGVAADLPMVVTPIAIAYNLPDVDGLQLSSATLARIFSGDIMLWNDPAIAADNPGVSLPDASVDAVHRSDSSGITDNLTGYLDAVATADWTYGTGPDWAAPGFLAARGSDGVATTVKTTPNSIGYVELAYAKKAGLRTAKIMNAAGEFVDVSIGSTTKGVGSTTPGGTDTDVLLTYSYTLALGAYPLYLVTYEIVCTRGLGSAQTALVKSFLNYISSDAGQKAITPPRLRPPAHPPPDRSPVRDREHRLRVGGRRRHDQQGGAWVVGGA
nr:phosphate ABC transporter substrate-binding protein PstS [Pseudofrankia asymbiotica]